jgi:hypothetical protein
MKLFYSVAQELRDRQQLLDKFQQKLDKEMEYLIESKINEKIQDRFAAEDLNHKREMLSLELREKFDYEVLLKDVQEVRKQTDHINKQLAEIFSFMGNIKKRSYKKKHPKWEKDDKRVMTKDIE